MKRKKSVRDLLRHGFTLEDLKCLSQVQLIQLALAIQGESNSDPLTGLLNRRGFFSLAERLAKRARREHKPVSFLIVDLDNFKKVNDTHGHPVGDGVLKKVASLLLRTVRPGDLVVRLGGEEFGVFLPGAAEKSARRSVRRILRTLARTFICKKVPHVTASIGVASSERFGYGLRDGEGRIMKAADVALYASKRGGKNRFTLATRELVSTTAVRKNADRRDKKQTGRRTTPSRKKGKGHRKRVDRRKQ